MRVKKRIETRTPQKECTKRTLQKLDNLRCRCSAVYFPTSASKLQFLTLFKIRERDSHVHSIQLKRDDLMKEYKTVIDMSRTLP